MGRLVAELATAVFVQAPPAVQAAYAHDAFVTIHPFADGNRRVARLLTSIYLLRAISIPLLIWRGMKGAYLDALGAADPGDMQAFNRFVFDCALEAGNSLSSRLNAASSGRLLGTAADRVESLLRGRTGSPHAALQAIGARIFEAAIAALDKARDDVKLPEEVIWESSGQNGVTRQLDGYRALNHWSNEVWHLTIHCSEPVAVAMRVAVLPYVANAPESSFDFAVDAVREQVVELGARVSESCPAFSKAFENRIMGEAGSRDDRKRLQQGVEDNPKAVGIVMNSQGQRGLRDLRVRPAGTSSDYGVSFFSVFPVSSFGVQSFVLCASIFFT